MSNSNNTTSIEEIKSLIKSNITALGEGEIEIESKLWTDLGKLLDQAYTQGVTDTIERVEEEVIEPGIKHGTLPYPNPYGETVKVKRHNQVMQEVKNIQLTKLSSMKEKGMK